MKQAHRFGLLLLILAVAGCRHGRDMAKPATQENFGVQMARASLWREAMFRFRRAVELDPTKASAHNNLAVAYEANGDFDNAAKEYREALRLDRSNQYIQKNYSRYVEFLSRNKKRQQQRQTAAARETSPAATAAPAATVPQASAQPAAGSSAPPPSTPPTTTTAPAATTPPPATVPPATPPPTPPPAPNPSQGGSR